MQNYPKYLKTWYDVEFVVANFDKSRWQQDLERLCADPAVTYWATTGNVPAGETGVVDDTHRVGTSLVINKETGKFEEVQVQLEKRPNIQCRLGQMKFCETEEDLNKAIAAVKELLEDKQ